MIDNLFHVAFHLSTSCGPARLEAQLGESDSWKEISLSKHCLTDTRKNTSNVMFDGLMVMKANRKHWSESTAARERKGRKICDLTLDSEEESNKNWGD